MSLYVEVGNIEIMGCSFMLTGRLECKGNSRRAVAYTLKNPVHYFSMLFLEVHIKKLFLGHINRKKKFIWSPHFPPCQYPFCQYGIKYINGLKWGKHNYGTGNGVCNCWQLSMLFEKWNVVFNILAMGPCLLCLDVDLWKQINPL